MKYIKILIIFLFLLSTADVYASSIEYNIMIDKNQMYKENIKYTIDPTNTSDYLKSIFDNDVFFDKAHGIKYIKKISMENGNTVVILTHDGYITDLNKSDFLKTCFSEHEVSFDDYEISFYAVPEFKCLDHADSINIKVNTSIDSIVNNADSVSNGVYTWDKIDKNFYMNAEFGILNSKSPLNAPVKSSYVLRKGEVLPDAAFKDYSGAKLALLITTGIAILMVVIMVAKKAKTYESRDSFYDN